MNGPTPIIEILLVLGLLTFVAFGILLPIYLKNRQISGSICNHDVQKRTFIYKTSMTKEQIFQALHTHCETDALSCSVNMQESVLKFTWYHEHKEYFIVIKDAPGESLILLKAIHPFAGQTPFSGLLNPFMVKKLNAALLPYSEYEDAFRDQ